jgi:hypothetical protein
VADRNYREEAEALRRGEVAQFKTLLLAFDVIDKAVQSANSILEPLRRPKAQEEDARA